MIGGNKHMAPAELKQARQLLGLNIKQMAEALQTPYRTYQDWEHGKRRIPGIAEVAIKALNHPPQ